MSLLPQIKVKDLQDKDVSKLPSIELLNEDGQYVGTLIVPSAMGGDSIYDEIKTHAEYLGVRGNIVISPSVFDSLNQEPIVEEAPLYVSVKPPKPRKKRKRAKAYAT